MGRAMEIYKPIYELIIKIKNASNDEERTRLLDELYVESEIAERKFKALDEEISEVIKSTKELTGYIENLTSGFC